MKDAENGVPDAAFQVGMKYEALGQYEEAKLMYQKAIAGGHPHAMQMLLLLNSKLQQAVANQMQADLKMQIEMLQQQLRDERRHNQSAMETLQQQLKEERRQNQSGMETLQKQLQEERKHNQSAIEKMKAEAEKRQAEAERSKVEKVNSDPTVEVRITFEYVDKFDYSFKKEKFADMYKSEYLALKGDNRSLVTYIKSKNWIYTDEHIKWASIDLCM